MSKVRRGDERRMRTTYKMVITTSLTVDKKQDESDDDAIQRGLYEQGVVIPLPGRTFYDHVKCAETPVVASRIFPGKFYEVKQ